MPVGMPLGLGGFVGGPLLAQNHQRLQAVLPSSVLADRYHCAVVPFWRHLPLMTRLELLSYDDEWPMPLVDWYMAASLAL